MKSVPRLFVLAAALSLAAGCSIFQALFPHPATKPPDFTLRFFEETVGDMPEGHTLAITIPSSHQTFQIDPIPWITEDDVLRAELKPTLGGNSILLKFDAHGADKLTEMTERVRGLHFVVMINKRPVAAVLCEHPITNGQFLLFADMSEDESKRFVDSLNKTATKRRAIGDTRYEP